MEYKNMPLGADHMLTDRAEAYYVAKVSAPGPTAITKKRRERLGACII